MYHYDIKQLRRGGVYAIVNKNTGRAYIGKVEISFLARWNQHRKTLETKRHHCKALQEDWIESTEAAFDFVILEFIEDKVQMWDREKELIRSGTYDLYNTHRYTSK